MLDYQVLILSVFVVREPALELLVCSVQVRCVLALLAHWLGGVAGGGRRPAWLAVLVVDDDSFLWRLRRFREVLVVVLDHICHSELLEIYFWHDLGAAVTVADRREPLGSPGLHASWASI